MSQIVKVGRIAASQIDAAFCLVSLVNDAIDLEDWRRLCDSVQGRELRGGGDRVVVAANVRGTVQGLCIFRRRLDARHGRILDLSAFVVVSLAQAGSVADEMLHHLGDIARADECRGILIQAGRAEGMPAAADLALGEGVRLILDSGRRSGPRLAGEDIADAPHGFDQ